MVTKTKEKFFFFLIILIIIIDQITKFIIRINKTNLNLYKFFSITYTTNTGIAFGFFQGSNIIFIFLYLIVFGFILYNYEKAINFFTSSILITGGLISNLIDRIFLGHVVDFIKIGIWPTFNIADSCITIGVLLLIIKIIKAYK